MPQDKALTGPGLTIRPEDYRSANRTSGPAMAKAAEAWHYRVIGLGWREIAEKVGYANESNVQRAVKRYIGRLPEVNVDELRTLWRSRIEWLFARAALDVIQQRPGAVRAATGLATRASELDGLDAPHKIMFKIDLNDPDHMRQVLEQLGIELVEEGDPFRQIDILDADVIDDDESDDDESDDDEDDDE